jgi:hypothetical protein
LIGVAGEKEITDLIYFLENPSVFNPLMRRQAADKVGESSYKSERFRRKAISAMPVLSQTFLEEFPKERQPTKGFAQEVFQAMTCIAPEFSFEFAGQKRMVFDVAGILRHYSYFRRGFQKKATQNLGIIFCK